MHIRKTEVRLVKDDNMMTLTQAPRDKHLKIVAIQGGSEVRRRLFSLGFHINDVIELDSKSIFRGPVLIRNINSDSAVAVGRGIAQKIMVEIIGA